MSFESWLGNNDWAAASAFEHAVLGYLAVSLVAPLSWMLAIEICRRLRTPANDASGQRLETNVSRLAFLIARLRESRMSRLASRRLGG